MIYKEQLEIIHRELTERKDDLERELNTLPEGKLHIVTHNNCTLYYERLPKKGNRKKEHRIGISHESEKINALVRKKYIEEALGLLERNAEVIEKALAKYRAADENSVMQEFFEKNPQLAEAVYYANQSDAEWADSYMRQEDYYNEGLVHTSAGGTKMRSKGEVYIASRLDHYGIPYRYEARVGHPDVNRVPDFTIRRPRDEKIIYWEHLGKTTDEEYMKDNYSKFAEYESIGIVPWDNLIVSYDRSDGGIDAKLIDALIQGWLI